MAATPKGCLPSRLSLSLSLSRFLPSSPSRLRLFPIGESKLTRTRGIRFPCPSPAQTLPLSFFSTAIFTTAETNDPARSMDPVRKAWNCIPHDSHLPFPFPLSPFTQRSSRLDLVRSLIDPDQRSTFLDRSMLLDPTVVSSIVFYGTERKWFRTVLRFIRGVVRFLHG